MKKIISLFFLLLLFFSPFQSHAKTAPDSTDSAKIEYFLPYPGILPGSPIYPLKALRDRIIEFFISDPGKRAEFYLLQADKRLNAAISLLEKDKGDLSESTVSKAEKYLDKALAQAEEVKSRGQNNDTILENIQRSSAKHKEVLESLVEKTDGELSKRFSQSLKLNQDIINRVTQLRATE